MSKQLQINQSEKANTNTAVSAKITKFWKQNNKDVLKLLNLEESFAEPLFFCFCHLFSPFPAVP